MTAMKPTPPAISTTATGRKSAMPPLMRFADAIMPPICTEYTAPHPAANAVVGNGLYHGVRGAS